MPSVEASDLSPLKTPLGQAHAEPTLVFGPLAGNLAPILVRAVQRRCVSFGVFCYCAALVYEDPQYVLVGAVGGCCAAYLVRRFESPLDPFHGPTDEVREYAGKFRPEFPR